MLTDFVTNSLREERRIILIFIIINIFKMNFAGTIYPGLMITSAALYRISWLLNITLDIRNICVFLAPLFSSLTTIITYLLTKELKVKFIFWLQYSVIFPEASTAAFSNHVYFTFLGFRIRPICSCNDRNCTWLYISISCRFLWQWRHSNLLYAIHILHVDQSCENRSDMLGYVRRIGLLLYGVFVGRICFSD